MTLSTLVCNILSHHEIKNICISPGSRNTPLTLGLLSNNNFKCYSHIDERSGGFFGLGISKTSGSPVAVLTTSGTATANLMPAIIEAELCRTPLIVLTADRPSSLVNIGATQTINQVNLYGKHVRGMLDIDHKKNNGWIHISQLKKSKSLITTSTKILFKKPTKYSKPLAKLDSGRLLLIKKCEKNWCNVNTDQFSGWVDNNNIWGNAE